MFKVIDKKTSKPKYGFGKFEIILKLNKDIDQIQEIHKKLMEDVNHTCEGKSHFVRLKNPALDFRFRSKKMGSQSIYGIFYKYLHSDKLDIFSKLYLEKDDDLMAIVLIHKELIHKCYRLVQ